MDTLLDDGSLAWRDVRKMSDMDRRVVRLDARERGDDRMVVILDSLLGDRLISDMASDARITVRAT